MSYTFTLTFFMHGIGNSGDTLNPDRKASDTPDTLRYCTIEACLKHQLRS
jgi:hypothetical protein